MTTIEDGGQEQVKCSVIVRCRNEERWIGHAIQSVVDNLRNSQIIVIDNKSTDESMDIVRMFEHYVDIQKLTISNYSPGSSLNLGVQSAKYNIILILSAHCVITKFHLKIIELLNKYVAVFGKQIPVFKGKKITPRYFWSNFENQEKVNPFCDFENRYFLHNAMCLYQKETLLKHPFDTILYGKEDRYWAKDIIKKGFEILYTPEIECLHHWTAEGATWKGIG